MLRLGARQSGQESQVCTRVDRLRIIQMMRRQSLSLVVAFFWFATAARPAQAHGTFPATSSISVRPGANDELVIGTTFGVLLSSDQGRSWQWICENALTATARALPIIKYLANGSLLAGDFFGLTRSTDRGCTWKAVEAFVDVGVMDVQIHPSQSNVLHATTGRFGQLNSVFVSENWGETFIPLGLSSSQSYFSGVRVAPSDPLRIYVSAWWPQPMRSWLFRSDDRGAHFTQVYESPPELGPLTVLAISPTDRQVLFVASSRGVLHTLSRSDDGGATFTTVLEANEVFQSVSISADGQRVLAARANGFYRSEDRGQTFHSLATPSQNVCLFESASTIYACGSPLVDGFAAASTADFDAGWRPLLQLNEIRGPAQCPPGTPAEEACPSLWPAEQEWIRSFQRVDAGQPDAGRPKAIPTQPGCRCAQSGGLLWLALGLLVRCFSSKSAA